MIFHTQIRFFETNSLIQQSNDVLGENDSTIHIPHSQSQSQREWIKDTLFMSYAKRFHLEITSMYQRVLDPFPLRLRLRVRNMNGAVGSTCDCESRTFPSVMPSAAIIDVRVRPRPPRPQFRRLSVFIINKFISLSLSLSLSLCNSRIVVAVSLIRQCVCPFRLSLSLSLSLSPSLSLSSLLPRRLFAYAYYA